MAMASVRPRLLCARRAWTTPYRYASTSTTPSTDPEPSSTAANPQPKSAPAKTRPSAGNVQGSLGSNSVLAAALPSTTTTDTDMAKEPGFNWPAISTKLDPRPTARRRWERRMLIRSIRTRGAVPRALQIKRSERAHTAASELWHTSMKKLQPLATQIAGKPIEEAILQMRFSKKKAAVEVRAHLEHARDAAIVERGMGLGKVHTDGRGKQTIIRLKDGTRHVVRDATGIYVDQAWVGKGTPGRRAWARARGRIDVQKLPQTRMTLLLKEEKTRIREHEDRMARERRRPVWTQHKDRPLYGQRPYYSW